MDYEKIVYDCECKEDQSCYVCCEPLSWDRGELIEVELPIVGELELGGEVYTPAEFLESSSTKYAKIVLQDLFGEIVDTQVVMADSDDFIYSEEGIATCYYIVDKELSEKLKPGSYYLYVYLVNTLPKVNEKIPERTLMNRLITSPEGIPVTIF